MKKEFGSNYASITDVNFTAKCVEKNWLLIKRKDSYSQNKWTLQKALTFLEQFA